MDRPRRCAVVDDSRVVLDLMRVLLTQGGWEVATHSELTGLELQLRAWAPDVVLLDVGMPGASTETLRQRVVLLRVSTGAKIVLHSARDPEALAQLAERSGADAVLVKSGDHASVLAALDRIVPPRR
ncbi:MAG: response regulator [Myxococcales bacterium]|nr:response regulator [Myxococcales bacterium]